MLYISVAIKLQLKEEDFSIFYELFNLVRKTIVYGQMNITEVSDFMHVMKN